jgi:hypothetical protein
MNDEGKRGTKRFTNTRVAGMKLYHLTRPRFHVFEIVFAVICSCFIEHFVDTAVFECTLRVCVSISDVSKKEGKGSRKGQKNLHSNIACTLQTEVRIHLMLLCRGGIL